MKLSKKELMQRVSDLIEDDEIKISVLEDMEDSITDEGNIDQVIDNSMQKEYEELKWKYEDLKTRYKDRFLKGSEETEKEDIDESEETEKEVVDIKEI